MAYGYARVRCPLCRKSYQYRLSATLQGGAIRIGGRRYMRCTKCGRFAMFNIGDAEAYRNERGVYNLIYGIVLCIIGAIALDASGIAAFLLIFSAAFFIVGILFIGRAIALFNGQQHSKE